MNKIPTFFFDYIYYRANKLYFRREGRNSISSTILITVTQTLILLDIYLCFSTIFMSSENSRNYVNTLKGIFILGYCLFLVLNFKKYKNKYQKLKIHWRDETPKVNLYKGILVLFVVLIPWAVLILFAAYT